MTGRNATPPRETAPGRPAQLVLDLPLRPATGAGDFLVSRSNGAAIALIDRWPDWPHPAALIVGPPSSGKSHLAAVWQERTRAPLVAAGGIADATVEAYRAAGHPALVVEDIDRGIASERVLFHLLNHAREGRGHLLLTSRTQPGEIDVKLPDLRSRLRALAPVAIGEPDEALLAALIVKLFADRQLDIDPGVVAYMLRRLERSFEATVKAVEAVDRLALAKRTRVTRQLVGTVLDEHGSERDDES